MSIGLSNIQIHVVPSEPRAQPASGNASAILHELSQMLDDLLSQQQTAMIDLRSLPLSAEDFEQLHAALGEGEVHARLDALGETRIFETAVSGIWWHIYYDSEGETLTEMLEVSRFPEILKSQPEDMRLGLQTLQSALHHHRNTPVAPTVNT